MRRTTAAHVSSDLRELVGACLDGASLLVEIGGDPGTGRTRLLGELAAHARERGLAVAYTPRTPEPAGRGAVHCLDDLHLADPPTRDGLRRLLAQAPRVPTVIACTVSDRPPAGPPHALAAAHSAYRLRRIALGPLGPAEFAALLPPGTGPVRAALLHRLSGGVPGWLATLDALPDPYLHELARTGLAPGPLPQSSAAHDGGALSGLCRLTPAQTEVARCAAVLGDPFSPALVAAVAGRDTAGVLAALDELAAGDLVRPADGGVPLFRFRHPMLRAVLYDRTPPGWRIAAHARAAAALARVDAPDVQHAPHLMRSAEPGDRAAAGRLARAAQELLDTRPALAAPWLRAALRILPAAAGQQERRRITALLYHADERTGQFAECRGLLPALLEPAEGRADTCGLSDRSGIADLHARGEYERGDAREARALLGAELHREPPPGPAAERTLRLRLAALAAAEGDVAATHRHVERAPACPYPAAAPEASRLEALASLALAGALARDEAAASAAIGEAAALADALGDASLAVRLDAVVRLGRAMNLTERHAEAAPLLHRSLDIAHRTGRDAALPELLLGRGHAHAARGLLPAALRDAHEAEETAHLLGDTERAGWARLLRAWAVLWCDGPSEAATLAESVRRGPLASSALRAAATTVLELAWGRPESRLDLLLPVSGRTDHPLPAGTDALRSPAAAVPFGAATDAPRSAPAVRAPQLGAGANAREFAALVAPTAGVAGPRTAALCAQALHASDADAVRLLAEALRVAGRAGLAVLECRVRLSLADRLTAAHRLEEAHVEAGRAKEWADQAGASWLRRAAVDAQRRAGACRPRGLAAPRTAPGGTLSVREGQVLDMVCRGMSNQDVAGALFVSVKTVEAHLTRIFRKTGARSRVSLAATFAARPAGV